MQVYLHTIAGLKRRWRPRERDALPPPPSEMVWQWTIHFSVLKLLRADLARAQCYLRTASLSVPCTNCLLVSQGHFLARDGKPKERGDISSMPQSATLQASGKAQQIRNPETRPTRLMPPREDVPALWRR